MLSLLGRCVLAIGLWLEWMASMTNALQAHSLPYTRGADMEAEVVPGRLALALGALAAVLYASLFLFARGWEIGWTGLTAVAVIAVGRQIEKRQWPEGVVIGLGNYYPSAGALLAFLIVRWLAGGPVAAREAHGWEAGCGVLAACFTIAGMTKHRKSGWGWTGGRNMALLIAERSYKGDSWVYRLRAKVASYPRACGVVAVGSLLLEDCGFLYMVHPIRAAFAAATTAMFAGILVLLGYIEVHWVAAVIALTLLTAGGPG
jgi:hypothetical protein